MSKKNKKWRFYLESTVTPKRILDILQMNTNYDLTDLKKNLPNDRISINNIKNIISPFIKVSDDIIELMRLQPLNKKYHKSNYTKDQILTVLENIDNKSLDEISNMTNLSKRQIKKIRYIKRKGTEQDIDILLRESYYISSIERRIKRRITQKRRADKIKNRRNNAKLQ